MSDTDLKIKITTTADTTGAKAAATALGEVTGATKKSSDASKEQGKRVNEMGETFEKASAAGRMLGEVATGNVAALGQFGAVIKAVGASFKANPLFMIGSLVAMMVIPVFKKLSDGWEAQKKAAEEAGKAAEESMQKARDAIAKKATNALADAYKEIETNAALALSQIEAVSQAVLAQTDSEEAATLAEIDANDQLSNEEKLKAKLVTSKKARDTRTETNQGKLRSEDETAAIKARESKAAIAIAAQSEATAGRMLGAIEVRSPENIKKDLAAIEKERAGLKDKMEPSVGVSWSQAQGNVLRDRELQQRKSDLGAEAADAETTYKPKVEKAEKAFTDAKDARVTAEKKAAEDAKAAEDLKNANDLKRKTIGIQQSNGDRVANAQFRAALPGAQAQDIATRNANDDADVRSGINTTLQTGAMRAHDSVLNIGQDARKSGNKEQEALAKKAFDAINATRDGIQGNEGQEVTEALRQLTEYLAANNKKSAKLEGIVNGMAGQIKALANQAKNSQTLGSG